MSNPDFSIVYNGGDANQHAVDMRLLALSMLGAERIVSDGLILLYLRRLPKRGERAPLVAKVREPVEGSLTLIAGWQAVRGLLDLGGPLSTELTGFFLEEWWKAIISRFTGKTAALEKAIEAMVVLNRDHLAIRDANDARQLASRDASDARQHEERMRCLDLIRIAIEGQQRSLEGFVAPIGPSVDSAVVQSASASPVFVNLEDADIIRDNGKLDWSALEQFSLKTDGFRFHTSGLSVANPERDGFLMARVRDPRFDEMENPYTDAAQRRAEIVVLGRRGYKDQVLRGIEIVDFIRTIAA